jgi:hypothetical protein
MNPKGPELNKPPEPAELAWRYTLSFADKHAAYSA